MAKDKKGKKAKSGDGRLELIAGPNGSTAKKSKKAKADKKHHGGLEQLLKIADHPLVGDLLAVGALAAVAAIAEAGKEDTAKMKSTAAVKAACKAAAAAIGTRLLKEMGSGADDKNAKA